MANETNTKSSPIPEDQDTYLFMGPVTDESCKDLIGYILCANIKKSGMPISITLKPSSSVIGEIVMAKNKVKSLLNGFKNISVEEFEEGDFPRRLYFVVNKKL
mgnify:CR=1 FL=1